MYCAAIVAYIIIINIRKFFCCLALYWCLNIRKSTIKEIGNKITVGGCQLMCVSGFFLYYLHLGLLFALVCYKKKKKTNRITIMINNGKKINKTCVVTIFIDFILVNMTNMHYTTQKSPYCIATELTTNCLFCLNRKMEKQIS